MRGLFCFSLEEHCLRSGMRMLLVGLVLITRLAIAAPDEAAKARVQKKLDAFHESSGFPGAVAGVFYRDGRSFAVATGVSDREAKTPMRPTDLMHGGSIGKTFFAAVALQLVAEGKLQLDDQISKYLGAEPWFAKLPNGDAITVRMLLNHTTGLPGFGDDFMRALVEDPAKERPPLETVQSVTKALHPAGAKFSYSDVNYQLLAFIIEKVTGQTAYAEIRRRLLEPLKLTGIVPADRPKIPGLVPGYAGAKNPFGGDKMVRDGVLVMDPRFEWGGGGFVTNPLDLARWMAAFSTGRAFDAKLLPEVFQTVDASELGEGAKSALGVEVEPTPLGEAHGHGGFFPGYFTQARWYPEAGVAVAVQLNTSDESRVDRSLKDFADELAQAALPPKP